MDLARICLFFGGMASFLITALHIGVAVRPQAYRYFNAGELVEMHEKGSSFTVLVTLSLAAMFAIWGVYGFSGAEIIRELPLLQVALITIGAIYILRSLMLPNEIFKVVRHGYPVRFIILSTGSLVFGLLYLVGALAH